MSTPAPVKHPFFAQLARLLNSGQSRSVLLSGNVHDLLYSETRDDFVPLVDYLCERAAVPGLILVVYELNGPVRVLGEGSVDRLRSAWAAWQAATPYDDLVLRAVADVRVKREREALEAEFDRNLRDATGQPTVALEFLRQLALCSRSRDAQGRPYLAENLLVIVEAADLLLPDGGGDVTRLPPADRHRVAIVQDWCSDPGFQRGGDSLVLLAESRGLVHPRVARLPMVLSVEIPSPSTAERLHFVRWFLDQARRSGEGLRGTGSATAESLPRAPELAMTPEVLAATTAGLSIHALRQLLLGAAHGGEPVTAESVVEKVQAFVEGQLGEDVVEFKRPEHTLDDVVGFTDLKAFLRDEMIPRLRAGDAGALPGAAVAGPIGAGKTFIFEAVASELGIPVLVLKNLRSQWFGQTDVIFERLRRVLESLDKAMIFVDEADTQFGGVGANTHETERRLTGKIQQMMSDPRLRGRISWLLMTARIHLLSPDIRRPGRVGDLIIPVLDPEGDDRRAFLRWTLEGRVDGTIDDAAIARLDEGTPGWSAAGFASLRAALKARCAMLGRTLALDEAEAVLADLIPPAIDATRRFQTLQALLNCTRRSLLPASMRESHRRAEWEAELRAM